MDRYIIKTKLFNGVISATDVHWKDAKAMMESFQVQLKVENDQKVCVDEDNPQLCFPATIQDLKVPKVPKLTYDFLNKIRNQ
jgi:hypothetical protein